MTPNVTMCDANRHSLIPAILRVRRYLLWMEYIAPVIKHGIAGSLMMLSFFFAYVDPPTGVDGDIGCLFTPWDCSSIPPEKPVELLPHHWRFVSTVVGYGPGKAEDECTCHPDWQPDGEEHRTHYWFGVPKLPCGSNIEREAHADWVEFTKKVKTNATWHCARLSELKKENIFLYSERE